jgi:hypothetical protein
MDGIAFQAVASLEQLITQVHMQPYHYVKHHVVDNMDGYVQVMVV